LAVTGAPMMIKGAGDGAVQGQMDTEFVNELEPHDR
jgi:hypothetical protein